MKSCRHKRHDEIMWPRGGGEKKEERAGHGLLWAQAFPCGCKFSTCRRDKMKSCHHKRHDEIMWPRRTGRRRDATQERKKEKSGGARAFELWLQVFNLQERQDEILSPQETRRRRGATREQGAFRTKTPDPVSPAWRALTRCSAPGQRARTTCIRHRADRRPTNRETRPRLSRVCR